MTRFVGEDLSCERGGRLVFAGVGFSLAAGEALVLRGPNGAGKSSLLRVMAGLTPPQRGRLLWGGEGIDQDLVAHHGRLRLIAHGDAVKPALSLVENLRLWSALVLPGDGTLRERRCRHALDHFGLARLAEMPARYLSAGQRRRLALARLLLAPAPLWLLDEPRTALDADGTARLDAAIAAQRGEGGIVVLALHGGPFPAGARELDLAGYRGGATAAFPC